jgi:hypothetical protein
MPGKGPELVDGYCLPTGCKLRWSKFANDMVGGYVLACYSYNHAQELAPYNIAVV